MTNVHDIPEIEAPAAKPRNARRRMPTIAWDDAGYATGWAYRIHRAFRPALDIAYTERVEKVTLGDGQVQRRKVSVWTEGDPPACAFCSTDLISSWALIRVRYGYGRSKHYRGRYGCISRRLLQVFDSLADRVEKRHIVPGFVAFRFYEWDGSRYVEQFQRRVSQTGFVEILRSGRL